mmetsp:Transcript_23517/g.61866  ORF Transcript_23517/g.61866 Transcript_23517/m.61866 type:complete len:116 (-) Transcript_23517:28-375(-)
MRLPLLAQVFQLSWKMMQTLTPVDCSSCTRLRYLAAYCHGPCVVHNRGLSVCSSGWLWCFADTVLGHGLAFRHRRSSHDGNFLVCRMACTEGDHFSGTSEHLQSRVEAPSLRLCL